MQKTKKPANRPTSQPSTKTTHQLKNSQLQALINAVNTMMAEKLKLSTKTGWAILNLAQSVEDAFKPAAKMLETLQKDAQATVTSLLEPYENKEEEMKTNDELKGKIEELNADFIRKSTEVYDLVVDVDFDPISKDVFVDERNNPISLGLDVQHAFRPFIV